MSFNIFADNVAAINSKQGIETTLSGATRDFSITKVQWILISVSTNLRYETSPSSSSEASEKWCSVTSLTDLKFDGLKYLLTAMSPSILR